MPSGWAIAGRSFNFPIKRPKSGGKNPCYEPSQCGQNSFVGPLEMNGVQWPLRQRGRIFKIGVYDSSAGYSLTISLNWKRLSISTVNQRMGPTWTDVQQLLSIKKKQQKTKHRTQHFTWTTMDALFRIQMSKVHQMVLLPTGLCNSIFIKTVSWCKMTMWPMPQQKLLAVIADLQYQGTQEHAFT